MPSVGLCTSGVPVNPEIGVYDWDHNKCVEGQELLALARSLPTRALIPQHSPERASRMTAMSDAEILAEIRASDDKRFDDARSFVSVSYGTATQALGDLLKRQREPLQIIAIGETHPQPDYTGTEASDTFATEILPVLASRGFRDLVLELLPADVPPAELAEFVRSGRLSAASTPRLLEYFSWTDDQNGTRCLKILKECERLGITVHGGGFTLKDISKAKTGAEYQRRAAQSVYQNGKYALLRIANQGKPVISYGGEFHNNIDEPPFNVAFGKDLSVAHTYLELDLVLPSLLCEDIRRAANDEAIEQAMLTLKIYSNQIPTASTVKLVTRDAGEKREARNVGKYALVYPLR